MELLTNYQSKSYSLQKKLSFAQNSHSGDSHITISKTIEY